MTTVSPNRGGCRRVMGVIVNSPQWGPNFGSHCY